MGRLMITMPDELEQQVREEAKRLDLKISSLIRLVWRSAYPNVKKLKTMKLEE